MPMLWCHLVFSYRSLAHLCRASSLPGQVAAEAYRLLRPGGQLWISEMDFQTAGYKKLRGNVALYSLIRATGALEPSAFGCLTSGLGWVG
jgi:ubiquinone/menaquinone biosynthesis C-methylase UbiE